MTMLFAVIAWFWLPNGPGSAWFLDTEEKKFAVERIIRDNELYVVHEYARDGIETQRLTWRDAEETWRDWKLWFVLGCNICASVPSQALSVFLPLVVIDLGYSSIQANLVSIEPTMQGEEGLLLIHRRCLCHPTCAEPSACTSSPSVPTIGTYIINLTSLNTSLTLYL